MKLPRYTSTALPQLATLDPQTAAAAAAGPFNAVAEVSKTVSDFTRKMTEAEDRSLAREAESEASFRLSQFAKDPRYLQDEIDGEPTEQVMARDYDELLKELGTLGDDITLKTGREATKAGIQKQAAETGLDVISVGNQIRIRRTKARNDKTIDQLQMGGNWNGAKQAITAGYEDGLYTSAERDAKNEANDKLERLTPYITKIGLKDSGRMNELALGALQDPTLRADEKVDMWRALSGAADQADSEFYAERNRIWSDNSVDMWSNYDQLTAGEIATFDTSPAQRNAAIKMKRAEAIAAGQNAQDNPQAVAQINELIASQSEGGSTNAYITDLISGYAAAEQISFETARKLQLAAIEYSNKVFAGVGFKDIVRSGQNAITNGVVSEDLFTFYKKDIANQLTALSTEWEQAMVSSKIAEGAGFDPKTFYKDNLETFTKRAEAIQNRKTESPTVSQLIAKYPVQGGGYDRLSVIEDIQDDDNLTPAEKKTRIDSLED